MTHINSNDERIVTLSEYIESIKDYGEWKVEMVDDCDGNWATNNITGSGMVLTHEGHDNSVFVDIQRSGRATIKYSPNKGMTVTNEQDKLIKKLLGALVMEKLKNSSTQ